MKRLKFSDIVYNITEKKMPELGDEKTYIGLEHLDAGSFNIKCYGSEVELKGTKLVMHKGDILFGRRNTYLRRVAIAPHNGLFSAHGMIFRPKENVILPEFLPIFIESDYFMDEAIKISVGSLSPTVNWKTLKELEFNIPTLLEQKKISDIIWSIINSIEAYKELEEKTDEMIKSRFIEMFGDPVTNPMKWQVKSLSELGDCKNGMNFHKGESGVDIHCLGVGDFQNLSVITDASVLPIVSLNENPSEEYMLQDGDIVFVRSNGNKNLVGRCLTIYPHDTPTTFSGFCIRYRISSTDKVLTEYLLQVLKHDSMRQKMTGRGANIQNLNQQILSALQIPLPSIDLQRKFIEFVKLTDKSKFTLQQSISALKKVKSSLLLKFFMQ